MPEVKKIYNQTMSQHVAVGATRCGKQNIVLTINRGTSVDSQKLLGLIQLSPEAARELAEVLLDAAGRWGASRMLG